MPPPPPPDPATTRQQAWFDAAFGGVPVMVILRGHDPDRTVELCTAARAAGARLVEVPVQDDTSRAAFAAAVAWGREVGDVDVGAGTVVSVALLDQVLAGGAAFTVAPGLEPDVAAASLARGVPHLPGVATASEVGRALALGFRWQKAFPASVLGSAWVSAMAGPFPDVRFVATGGISLANAAEFLRAGVGAVSLGSSFAGVDPDDLARALDAADGQPRV